MTPLRALLLAVILVLAIWALASALREQEAPLVVEVSVHDIDRLRHLASTTTVPATTTSTASTTTSTAPRHVAVIRSAPRFDGSVPDAIRAGFARFGPVVAEEAVRVSRCETAGSFNPNATGSQGERGLFQIHPKYHQERIKRLGFTWDRMYEVGPNVAVAADLYAEQGWGPWTCRSAA